MERVSERWRAGKWLAVAGIAIVVVMFALWKQLDSSAATAAVQPATRTALLPPPVAAAPVVTAPGVKPATATVAPAPGDQPKKMDVESDAFFYKFQEVVPTILTQNAAKCYEGISKHLHRNQKLVLKFKVKIKDGTVTINDVKADVNTLDNAGLQTCFTQAVQRSSWHDDELPDWEAEDELVLRPERGMKKYMRDNIDYVGAEAPRD